MFCTTVVVTDSLWKLVLIDIHIDERVPALHEVGEEKKLRVIVSLNL